MIRLKEDETYISFAPGGAALAEREGVYRRDTRYLSRYHLDCGPTVLLASTCRENRLHQHRARIGANRGQDVAMLRTLAMRPDGFDDQWVFENTSREPQQFDITLEVEADFRDLFAAIAATEIAPPAVERRQTAHGVHLAAVSGDGIAMSASVAATEASDDLCWTFALAPGERRMFTLAVTLSAGDDGAYGGVLPSYDDWRAAFRIGRADPSQRRTLERAIDDLRMLLFSTEFGAYPAAGMPWFVNVFGRDALLTSMMLLEWHPGLLGSVLRLLAAHQGTTDDPFREEEPGRILHEMRRGELSRTGRIPFGRYYGAIDSTPLFVTALHAYVERTGDVALADELRPAWTAAMAWLSDHQQGQGGLVAFKPSGSGLTVQSWKDSADSMNHADGTPAAAPLSVAEVQGYTYSAFRAAAALHRLGHGDAEAAGYDARAAELRADFHRRFWIERLGTYAMALDGAGRPLEVQSSDPGHLLWSGIVPVEIAPRLVATMMGPELWSGWGLRTLGSAEARYNPVSYHNGSVWPHDTAIFAWGLHRYGFHAELATVCDALFDAAGEMPDRRMPELFAGVGREQGMPPTAYTHACYPQAWAAAALPLLAWLSPG